jgi:hypothetical protein
VGGCGLKGERSKLSRGFSSVLTEDEKREYADLIVEVFELKAKALL